MEGRVTESDHRRDQTAQAKCAILIVSDTRNEKTDASGKRIRELLEAEGHQVLTHQIVRNDQGAIQTMVMSFLHHDDIDVVITSGGTGISTKDGTVDALSELFEKTLIGFGEVFRRLSWAEIGEAAYFSRATAGIIDGREIFCLPGSKNAVDLALTQIILPSLGHLLWEAKR